MRYLKDFDTPRALRRYDLQVENDHVIIRYNRILPSEQKQEIPDEDMHISQMHIANIPALVGAIFKVFQMKDGGSVNINEYGDELDINMLFDDHGQIHELHVWDDSDQINVGMSHGFDFVFEDYMSINTPPLPRTPTPAMIWVTDTLKKIHEEWEERKKGKKE